MLVVRLTRSGAKKSPFYHVIATDKRSPRDGRFIEQVGYFNPVARGKETILHLDVERIKYFIKQGAQLSHRVKSLLKIFNKKAASETN